MRAELGPHPELNESALPREQLYLTPFALCTLSTFNLHRSAGRKLARWQSKILCEMSAFKTGSTKLKKPYVFNKKKCRIATSKQSNVTQKRHPLSIFAAGFAVNVGKDQRIVFTRCEVTPVTMGYIHRTATSGWECDAA